MLPSLRAVNIDRWRNPCNRASSHLDAIDGPFRIDGFRCGGNIVLRVGVYCHIHVSEAECPQSDSRKCITMDRVMRCMSALGRKGIVGGQDQAALLGRSLGTNDAAIRLCRPSCRYSGDYK
jgi:hypothetical protein